MTIVWSFAGLPCLSLAAGRAGNGLPLGMQCIARLGHDEALLAWTHGLAETLTALGI